VIELTPKGITTFCGKELRTNTLSGVKLAARLVALEKEAKGFF